MVTVITYWYNLKNRNQFHHPNGDEPILKIMINMVKF